MRSLTFKIAVLFILPVIFLTGRASMASAQLPIGSPPSSNSTADNLWGNQQLGGNPFENDDDPDAIAPGDSLKAPKIRKPLESYFFDDSIRQEQIFMWHVDTYYNKVEMAKVDTVLADWRTDYPFFKEGVGDAYQGNLGGASIPLSYFERPRYENFNFAQAYDTYFFFPDNTNFYNVKRPFTHITYLMAGQKKYAEEGFYLVHAQNISPSSGFNIDYRSRGTRGVYDWNRGRAKNLSLAYSHTGKKYSIHAGYIYNAIINKENAGVYKDSHVGNTEYDLAVTIPVRLYDARNVVKNNAYYLIQSYGIPLRRLTDEDFSIADNSSIFIGHSSQYSRWNRKYTDTYGGMSDSLQYYQNWYANGTATRDTIFESLISNRVFIQLQPWDRDGVVGLIDAGAGMDIHQYYQFVPDNYLTGNSKSIHRTSYYVYGAVDGKIKRYFSWGGDIKFHPAGYRSGDLKVGARAAASVFIKDNPVTLSGTFGYELRSPDYWSGSFFSNHYVWSEPLDKENETRFEVKLDIPAYGLKLGMMQSVITNKIYFKPEMGKDKQDQTIILNITPDQSSSAISVTGIYAHKDFRAGGFHFNHRVLLQWSTDQDIIPVPLASAYLSYFFEFNVVKNVLRMQIGVDGRYNTKYYAYGYDPAISAFYNQKEKKLGNYPYLDAFAAMKWKRMRILIKMQHVNQDLFGDSNYFTLLHYPQNQRVLKFGFSWGFYD